MPRHAFAMPALALMLALSISGCSSTPAEPDITTSPTTAEAAPAPSATPEPVDTSAAAIASAIKASVPSAGDVVQITEDNDPNDVIGRPTGYVDAATLYDTRVTCDELGAECGASVEIWGDPAAAQARMDYIQGILASTTALGTEYDYVRGDAIIRVTGVLKPSEASEYEAAIDAYLGAPTG
ncbi:hypothetical protein [Clavibacter zhangzhiyongii]|uniref:Lipoprotein n=1 Tax=Clavibacter zhangzhiyongii TaxID=2768071 RepID=A0A7L7Z0D8_9MICO|nr:hypothetical protein [Clavibacter zhangzhiyongii]QOD43159.1 hypothetical protein H9X71_11145 [Clavibacter zhangzhiyongii]